MKHSKDFGWRIALALAVAIGVWAPSASRAAEDDAVKRGESVFNTADCVGCHTDAKNHGQRLAGGRPLATPVGTFYPPNITPDKEHGIGKWSLADFKRALRQGMAPEGFYYYPVFPYTSFTGMSDQDIADLYAYLMAQPAIAEPNKRHEVTFPFGWRPLLAGWRSLFFTEGPIEPVAGRDAEWNRGRYLSSAVAHCGECHTPRNFLGGMETNRLFAGNPNGPDGQRAPNITPDPDSGIGKWSLDDVTTLLKSGQTPDFDFVGSGMSEVVNGTKTLSDADLKAIAVYLKSVPAIFTPKPPAPTKP
jgi:mono/diheme cytochrome c family protein